MAHNFALNTGSPCVACFRCSRGSFFLANTSEHLLNRLSIRIFPFRINHERIIFCLIDINPFSHESPTVCHFCFALRCDSLPGNSEHDLSPTVVLCPVSFGERGAPGAVPHAHSTVRRAPMSVMMPRYCFDSDCMYTFGDMLLDGNTY